MGIFKNLRSLFSPSIVYRYGYIQSNTQVENLDTVELYRTQPNLRAVVGFLADNAAQIPFKVYDRARDDDRPRVLDSPAALLLQHPNEDMTPYEFKRRIYADLLLYDMCLCLVLPDDSPAGWQIRPVPATWVLQFKGNSPLAPESVIIQSVNSGPQEVPASKFLLFHGYSPDDLIHGSSPVQALKDVLHEQVESNRFRRQMWTRGGRFNAYVWRPKDVEPFTNEGFERFKEDFNNSWAGDKGTEAGRLPILEDGMEIRQAVFNSRDAQWADAKKLGREDVAGVFHVNPALIWPGSGQTYASAKDNARALYNETLAPLLMQVTDRINAFLLPKIGEESTHYVNYDITIKTEGTFEEKISALQSAVGAPFLTRDEARARLNLPAIGANELIVPLNVLEGGLASNHDTDPTRERYNSAPPALPAPDVEIDEKSSEVETAEDASLFLLSKAAPEDDSVKEITDILTAFFERQRRSVLPKINAAKARGYTTKADETPEWWDADRWNDELAEDLTPAFMRCAESQALRTCEELELAGEMFSAERMTNYLAFVAAGKSRALNTVTVRQLIEALDGDATEGTMGATAAGVFDKAVSQRAPTAGQSFATSVSAWGSTEAVRQVGDPDNTQKVWRVGTLHPRPTHAKMNGKRVAFESPFPNGMMYPGDHTARAEETCNCHCTMEIQVRKRR